MTRRVSAAKVVPPPLPTDLVPRPELLRALGELAQGHVAVLSAGSGYGKTALLSAWALEQDAAWYTADAEDAEPARLAMGLIEALRVRTPGVTLSVEVPLLSGSPALSDGDARATAMAVELVAAMERAPAPVTLVIDELEQIPADSPGARLVEALAGLVSTGLRLILASRNPVKLRERHRGQGRVLELDARQLAFSPDETAEVAWVALPGSDRALAARVHALTEGWPAAVRMAVNALRPLPPALRLSALARAETSRTVTALLSEEVLPALGAEQRRVLELAAVSPAGLDAELARLCGADAPDAAIRDLVRRGLLVPHDVSGQVRCSPMVAAAVFEVTAVGLGRRGTLARSVAGALESQGDAAAALRVLADAGDHGAALALVERLEPGAITEAQEVIRRWAPGVPAQLRTPTLDAAYGEALFAGGAWTEALALLAPLASINATAAFRTGFIHHMAGGLEAAGEAYRAGLSGEAPGRITGLVAGWYAALVWVLGDRDECRRLTRIALETAATTGDPQVAAVAETAAAMLAAMDGDRRANAAHYLRALDAAERARDSIMMVRIRANRASALSDEGSYAAAVQLLDEALTISDLAGGSPFHSLVLLNRGHALHRLGRLDEAARDLTLARDEAQAIGHAMLSYALTHLAEVQNEQGLRVLAQAGFREAVDVASAQGDVQGIVPALSGLARALAEDEPDAALATAQEAVSFDSAPGRPAALLALAQVHLARGESREAAAAAHDAETLAAHRRNRAVLAGALEVQAASTRPWRRGGGPSRRGRIPLGPGRRPARPRPQPSRLGASGSIG